MKKKKKRKEKDRNWKRRVYLFVLHLHHVVMQF